MEERRGTHVTTHTCQDWLNKEVLTHTLKRVVRVLVYQQVTVTTLTTTLRIKHAGLVIHKTLRPPTTNPLTIGTSPGTLIVVSITLTDFALICWLNIFE